MIGARELSLLGLGVRGGSVVTGAAGVRAGLQRSEVVLVVLADGHSARTEEKVARLARARGIPLLSGPAADVLGGALGRGPLQAVGVTDRRLAAGLVKDGSSRQEEL